MKMQKRQFRIGELAKTLEVEQFVIRFWEKEFEVSSFRSEGGQRFYTEKDLTRFQAIKKLLYEEGFTIAGAKKQLNSTPPTKIATKIKSSDSFVPALQEASFNEIDEKIRENNRNISKKLNVVREQLLALRSLI